MVDHQSEFNCCTFFCRDFTNKGYYGYHGRTIHVFIKGSCGIPLGMDLGSQSLGYVSGVSSFSFGQGSNLNLSVPSQIESDPRGCFVCDKYVLLANNLLKYVFLPTKQVSQFQLFPTPIFGVRGSLQSGSGSTRGDQVRGIGSYSSSSGVAEFWSKNGQCYAIPGRLKAQA